ncbi:MAG: exo-alpha-sialidase, partial [Deltaproteobacteria bacterium]|nr:exo-alpha-sialidase [Deltaproteobacteria bacterium]
NPDPEDTRWGDWGHGGTCLPSTCGESQAYNNAGGSTCPPTPFADARKWLFVYSVDFTARNGQTTTDRVAYGATSIIGHVHELGHVGRLEHGGPFSSAGAASEIDSNYRPNYPSRISYMFQNVGGFDRSPGRPVWQSVSFSSGAWAAPWSSRGISEECPLSTGTSLGVLNEVGERATQDSRCVPGSWSVDWDHSGIIEPGLRPMARIYDNYRIRRQVEIVDARALRASGSAAVIGERGVTGRAALVYADVSLRDDAGRAFIELRADGEGDCSEYPRPPTAVRDAGYPPCFDHGAPIAIGFDGTIEGLAVAITSAPVMVDGSLREGAVMVWHDPSDQLRWATFTVRSDARADEEIELADYQDHGVTHINETVFGAIGSLEPALVRVSGIDGDPRTDEVVLAWRHGDGTRVRYASLEPGATGWSEARTAVDETGPLLVATAVSLASEGRNVWLAAAPVFGGGLVIHRRRAVLDEGFEWPLELRYEHPAACTTVRPALVRAPSIRDEDRTHHWLLWRGCDSFLWMAFDDFHADPLTPGSPPDPYASPQGFRPFHGSSDVMPLVGPVAVWDDRDTLPQRLHGLRVYRTHPAACRFDGECLTAPATSCLNGQCVDPDEPATSYGVVTLSPFGRGPEPGYHTDYDDWTGLRWGLCMAREHGTRVVPDFPPERTDDYVRRSYRTVRCGPAPHYLEPSAGGMAITSPGLDDREEHPWLYEPPGPVECLVQ